VNVDEFMPSKINEHLIGLVRSEKLFEYSMKWWQPKTGTFAHQEATKWTVKSMSMTLSTNTSMSTSNVCP